MSYLTNAGEAQTRIRSTCPKALLVACNRRGCEGDMRLSMWLRDAARCALCGRWRFIE